MLVIYTQKLLEYHTTAWNTNIYNRMSNMPCEAMAHSQQVCIMVPVPILINLFLPELLSVCIAVSDFCIFLCPLYVIWFDSRMHTQGPTIGQSTTSRAPRIPRKSGGLCQGVCKWHHNAMHILAIKRPRM